jgi:hypothetical protein
LELITLAVQCVFDWLKSLANVLSAIFVGWQFRFVRETTSDASIAQSYASSQMKIAAGPEISIFTWCCDLKQKVQ